MTKKKDISHQRLLAAARKALAARHAVQPVPRYEGRTANIDAARKRARRAANAPTVEQEAKADYVETDVNDYVGGRRVKIGRAFIGPSSTHGATMPVRRSPATKVVVFQWPNGTPARKPASSPEHRASTQTALASRSSLER